MNRSSLYSKVAAAKASMKSTNEVRKQDAKDPDVKMFTGGNPACDPITNGGGVMPHVVGLMGQRPHLMETIKKKRGAKKDAPINTKRLLTMSITSL